MASCFALGFGVLHWITSISGILWFVALLVFSLWIPLHKISYLYPQWLSCKFVGLLEGTLNIQSAIYFYPTATEQILIEDRDNFCEVHGPKFLLSFADQNHSLSNSICLNVLFVELCCKCQSFPREVPLLENRALWRNEDFSQVCTGVDRCSSSWGVLRARWRSGCSPPKEAEQCWWRLPS